MRDNSALNSKVKVAIVQASPVFLNKKLTLEKFRTLAIEAKATGAQLCVFPEAFIGGYPRGVDFGVSVGSRQEQGRDEFARYFENSLDEEDKVTIAKVAKEVELYLVFGAIEREGKTLFCTVFYYGPDGSCLGKHRKLMPTAAERLIWGTGDGSTLGLISAPFGKFGAAICWENYMPLLRYFYYYQGIQIYCAPTVDDRDSWIPTMKHIATEGRCFVLSACQYFPRSCLPKEGLRLRADFTNDPLIRGGSCIVGPMGQLIVEPNYQGETVLVGELDMNLITRAKFDLDVVGHYSRSDVFSLHVDTNAKNAVEIKGTKGNTEVHL